MARKETKVIDNYGGISFYKKIGQQGSFRFGKHLNIYDDPNDLTINVTGSKVSGSTVTGLIKWIVDGTPYDTNRYFYDSDGKIYQETAAGEWSVIRTVSNSQGQGLAVQGDYLYYMQNDQLGRYGPLSGTPSFTDNWQTGLNDTSATGFAPLITFKEGLAVGHGSNVAWWDGAVWTPNSLTLPSELSVRTFTHTDQYIVAGAWRGRSVTDSEDGYIFVWDSLSDTFNDFAPTDGGLNAMNYGNNNKLLSIQGHQGYIYTDSAPFNRVHQIPKVELTDSIEVYPGAITTWKGLTYFGISNFSSTTAENRGIYAYGRKHSMLPEALNYAFSISTGNSGSTVRIGALNGFGNELYIAWQDGTVYGVDKIGRNPRYATSATYESMMEDDQRPRDEKTAIMVEITHLPLAEGESIAVNWRKNRADEWTTGVTNSADGSIETTLPVEKTGRYHEFEWQTILTGPGTSTPLVQQQTLVFDDNKEERRE